MNICLQEIDWGMTLGIICIRKKGKGNWSERRIELWGNCNSSLRFSYVSSELSWIEASVLSLCISHEPFMEVPWNWRQGVNLGKVDSFSQGQFLWRKFICEFQQPTLPAAGTKNTLALNEGGVGVRGISLEKNLGSRLWQF